MIFLVTIASITVIFLCAAFMGNIAELISNKFNWNYDITSIITSILVIALTLQIAYWIIT